MRAAACAASSLANKWNTSSRAASTGRILVPGWWSGRKGRVVAARDIGATTTGRGTLVVVIGSHCRVGLAIVGATPGGQSSPQSSTWRLAGVWRAGRHQVVPVPRA